MQTATTTYGRKNGNYFFKGGAGANGTGPKSQIRSRETEPHLIEDYVQNMEAEIKSLRQSLKKAQE